MEVVKGYEYRLEGSNDIGVFAEGILILTNIKSSMQDSVVDIKTIEGTNTIIVKSIRDIKSYFESNSDIWKIDSVDRIHLIMDISLSSKQERQLNDLYDTDYDVFYCSGN